MSADIGASPNRVADVRESPERKRTSHFSGVQQRRAPGPPSVKAAREAPATACHRPGGRSTILPNRGGRRSRTTGWPGVRASSSARGRHSPGGSRMARGTSRSHQGIDRRTFLAGGLALGGGLAGLDLSRARLVSAQTPKRGGTLDRRGGDRPHRSRPPQQLELLLGPGVRPHLREPDVVRREDQHRAVPRHELGDHERREDLHVQAPPEREVPQRPDHDRRRREVQHRARPRPEDGVAVDLLAEVDQGDQGRRSLDRADEPRRPLSAPRLVRRDPGVGDHPQGLRRAGEPQDQGDRHRAVQARRVRAAGPDRLRAEPRLLGQVAPVPRRDGLQGPDGGERPDRRPARPARSSTRSSPARARRSSKALPGSPSTRAPPPGSSSTTSTGGTSRSATRASGAPCGWPSTRTR